MKRTHYQRLRNIVQDIPMSSSEKLTYGVHSFKKPTSIMAIMPDGTTKLEQEKERYEILLFWS